MYYVAIRWWAPKFDFKKKAIGDIGIPNIAWQ